MVAHLAQGQRDHAVGNVLLPFDSDIGFELAGDEGDRGGPGRAPVDREGSGPDPYGNAMEDITALILDDHHAFRIGFARLDDARGEKQLRAVWALLSLHLEIHAEAEERILYPRLLKTSENAIDETEDAIRDHNKIRDGIAEANRHPVDTEQWWAGVWNTRRENSEHLAEEEDEVLPDFRKHASLELRAELGARWLIFYGEHPSGRGLEFLDKDPKTYIEENI
jgi:hypothetical protein